MKRHLICALITALVFSGCTARPAPPVQTPTATPPSNAATTTEEAPSEPTVTVKQAPMCAVSLPVITENEAAEDGTVIFTNTYQNISMILQEPEIADRVIVDFLNRSDTTQAARQIKESAKTEYAKTGSLIAPYHCSMTYQPMRLDNSILSLLGTSSTFSGGMHPENITKAITYDLLTGSSLRCSAILLETVTAEDLLPLIYNALETQKDSLYEDYKTMVADKFSHGIDQNNDWYFSAEGLCFFFSPYEIGPFASGTIVAQVSYDQLTQILRDIYFPAERDTALGSVHSIPYRQADLEDYSQFAEVTIAPGAEKVLLVTDSSVHDLRIVRQMMVHPSASYTESYTIFAAYGLTPGDAIVLETETSVQLLYRTGDRQITETVPTE